MDSPSRADNKHQIRQQFHWQLKRLWEITPFLKKGEASGPSTLLLDSGGNPKQYDVATLATRYQLYGFNFVPLVTEDLELMCSLDILFLRPDRPQLFWAGDIDNRLKTLFDAMKIPDANEGYATRRKPLTDEQPFFVLLEKDELITKVSVETDQLLSFDEVPGEESSKKCTS